MEKEILLPLVLEISVPIMIADMKKNGGPTKEDLSRMRNYISMLGEHGEALFYRSKKTADVFNTVSKAIAILSFCPGGIDIFGHHWEAK